MVMSPAASATTTWHVSTDVGFGWVTPLLRLGAARALQEQDLLPLPRASSAAEVRGRLQSLLPGSGGGGDGAPSRSLRWAMWTLVGPEVLVSGCLQLVYACCQLVTPLLVRRFILEMEEADAEEWRGWLTVGGLFLSISVAALANQHHIHGMVHVGLLLRSAVVSAVFAKSVRMSAIARMSSGTSRGELINLMSNDATRILETMPLIHLCWSAPLQILVASVLLWQLIGWASLVGTLCLACIIPVSRLIARYNMKIRARHMELSDERVKLCSEVTRAIKVVKTYGWETAFESQIVELREEEMQLTQVEANIYALTVFFMISFPIGAFVAAMGSYTVLAEGCDDIPCWRCHSLPRSNGGGLTLEWRLIVPPRIQGADGTDRVRGARLVQRATLPAHPAGGGAAGGGAAQGLGGSPRKFPRPCRRDEQQQWSVPDGTGAGGGGGGGHGEGGGGEGASAAAAAAGD
jgi:hypothetical protein